MDLQTPAYRSNWIYQHFNGENIQKNRVVLSGGFTDNVNYINQNLANAMKNILKRSALAGIAKGLACEWPLARKMLTSAFILNVSCLSIL
jgi:hypothetical protein